MKTRIFVYGSLMTGLHNNYLLGASQFCGRCRTEPRFTMISFGGFPGVNAGGETAIVGEVFAVDAITLARLDRLESAPSFYHRERVNLDDGTTAELYVLTSPHESPVVPSGDWRKKVRARAHQAER